MKEDPAYNRKTPKTVVKRRCNDGDEHIRKDHLCQLTSGGEMNRISTSSSAVVWAEALEGLPPETFKFALNASHDTFPHNANLSLWGKKTSDQCLLCGERQSLIHVLNACTKALELRRYNERHDAVLSEPHQRIKEYLTPSMTSIVDLEDYQFPQQIARTDLRPDIVCWDEDQKKIVFVELTVCFETNFKAAADRKQEKYLDLAATAQSAGYSADIVTIIPDDSLTLLVSRH